MKNILITANYKVGHMYGNTDTNDYAQLSKICMDSFVRNLKDITQVTILKGEMDTYHNLFRDIYKRIKEIYFSEQCNILWVDSDNVCLRPLEIFNQFDKFAMFYSVEEYRTAFVDGRCLKLTEKLSPWMMANIRYYPAGMLQKLWDIGDDLAYSWVEDWAYETIIYNAMFHAQDIDDYNAFMHPEWNVQGEGDLNSITQDLVNRATILHVHSTRDSKLAIQKMEKAIQLSGGDKS